MGKNEKNLMADFDKYLLFDSSTSSTSQEDKKNTVHIFLPHGVSRDSKTYKHLWMSPLNISMNVSFEQI